jgi:hypothetical protein
MYNEIIKAMPNLTSYAKEVTKKGYTCAPYLGKKKATALVVGKALYKMATDNIRVSLSYSWSTYYNTRPEARTKEGFTDKVKITREGNPDEWAIMSVVEKEHPKFFEMPNYDIPEAFVAEEYFDARHSIEEAKKTGNYGPCVIATSPAWLKKNTGLRTTITTLGNCIMELEDSLIDIEDFEEREKVEGIIDNLKMRKTGLVENILRDPQGYKYALTSVDNLLGYLRDAYNSLV